MNTTIPSYSKAVVLSQKTGKIEVGEVPVCMPCKGEVLIKMHAAPINPSDVNKLKNLPPLPKGIYVPGIEGCGTVVAAGKGILPKFLNGKRVACVAMKENHGTWSEYVTTNAGACFPINKSISDEQGAMLFVNPLTALAFFDIASGRGHKAIINTASAGALGRIVEFIGKKRNIKVINIVRSQEQKHRLITEDARCVISTDDDNFYENLRNLIFQYNASVAFDSVGGSFSKTLLMALPPNGELIVYGNLSGEAPVTDHRVLVMEGKKISGFFLGTWSKNRNLFKTISQLRAVNKMLKSDLSINVRGRFSLEEIPQALELFNENMTAGKLLLKMDN